MGLFDFLKKGKKVTKNNQPEEAEMDYEILKAMQDKHPWLVRTAVDDALFAKFMPSLDIALIKDDEKFSITIVEEAYAIIGKGLKIHVLPDGPLEDSTCMWTIVWLRYVCLTNNLLYKYIISNCFNNDTLLKTKEDRLRFIQGRLLGMQLMEYQIDDIYYILKGYMDTMNQVGSKVADNMRNTLLDKKKKKVFVDDVNEKYGDTENVKRVWNISEIADLATRDFIIKKKVNKEKDIIETLS